MLAVDRVEEILQLITSYKQHVTAGREEEAFDSFRAALEIAEQSTCLTPAAVQVVAQLTRVRLLYALSSRPLIFAR